MRTRKRLLITGCGRSGTKYVTHLLRRLGLDVPHERMGADGIASWAMAVDADAVVWGVSPRDYDFEHVFHQVRDPREVIASATTFKPRSWDFICAHTPVPADDPVVLRAAKYWYYWNLEAEKIAGWRYRIDALADVFEEFCARLHLTRIAMFSRRWIRTSTRAGGAGPFICTKYCVNGCGSTRAHSSSVD